MAVTHSFQGITSEFIGTCRSQNAHYTDIASVLKESPSPSTGPWCTCRHDETGAAHVEQLAVDRLGGDVS
jgi:hypothetical protein